MNKQEIGAYVRRHRNLRGMTQQQLADKAELTKDVVFRLENGRGLLGDNAYQRIANVLDIVIPTENIVPEFKSEDDIDE